MKRKQNIPVYQRENGRYYGDLRGYRDVLNGQTGRHMALVAPGEKVATRDRAVALKIASEMVLNLEAKRRNHALTGHLEQCTLGEFAGRYLVLKKRDGRVNDELLVWAERVALPRALSFFGAGRPLSQISVTDIRRWSEWLATQVGARRRSLSPQTVRHHLNLLSNLYRYAQQEAVVSGTFNPVRQLVAKPIGTRHEARWLEVTEAGRLLEAAAECYGARASGADGVFFPMLATLLLTGARKAEALGLELNDVDLDRLIIRIRPNQWRTLKTRTSNRTVPIWPQLAEILGGYLKCRGADSSRSTALVFATMGVHGETMITDFRKVLDRTARRAGLSESVTAKMFRHTYCAARLQTLDNGAPVSPFTVARELGHGGDSMVKAVYGHLGTVRHRSDVVEYRPPQQPAVPADMVRVVHA
jgi:integrase